MPGIKEHRNADGRLGRGLFHPDYAATEVKPNTAGATEVLQDEVDMVPLGQLEIGIEKNSARRNVTHKGNVLLGAGRANRDPRRQAHEGSRNTAGHTFADQGRWGVKRVIWVNVVPQRGGPSRSEHCSSGARSGPFGPLCCSTTLTGLTNERMNLYTWKGAVFTQSSLGLQK